MRLIAKPVQTLVFWYKSFNPLPVKESVNLLHFWVLLSKKTKMWSRLTDSLTGKRITYKNLGDMRRLSLHELFCVRLRSEDEKMTERTGKTIVHQVISYWNGCSLSNEFIKKIRGIKSYKYMVENDDSMRRLLCLLL